MPSEHRLHPLSILFNLGSQVRAFLVPGILFLFGARSAGMGWDVWVIWLLIPYTLFAVVRYLTFQYRYDDTELVIQSGLLFRNERHIPYARIQNIDAVQNVFHRAFRVVTVRLQTAAGSEPEASMSVLPIGDLAVMRQRVFARHVSEPLAGETAAAPAPAEALLRLSPRELMLYGFIENRGLIVVSAAFGLLWEAGILDGMMDRVFGDEAWGRGVARDTARAVFGDHVFPVRRVLTMLAAFAGFLILVRLLSMVWAAIRLHDFTVTRSGDDLQTTYGLLTRVTATVPLRRVQAVTIREGPLHRLTSRVSVRVVTAGGAGASGRNADGSGGVQREWLAPIVARDRLPDLLHEIAPGFDLAQVEWRDVHPRAFRREVKQWLFLAVLLGLPAALIVGWWDLVVLAAFAAWGWFVARRQVAHLHWAVTGVAVLCRKGWLWRYVTLTPLAKIQAVTRYESPFDRRMHMGHVIVDAAGAGNEYRVDIPYLPRETARELAGQLAAAAARTEFKW